MKKAILILLVVLVLFAVGYLLLRQHTSVAPVQQPVGFPTSSTTSPQDTLLSLPDVHPDLYNQGYYYVGNQPTDDTDNAPYIIRYISETKYFNIGITQEPIGENRRKAETYLMQLLGATKEQMCSLNYAVYVSNRVNAQYTGEDLRFSFCPDAVQLPY